MNKLIKFSCPLSDAELRHRLLQHRENYLAHSEPEIDRKQGLLRRRMIDFFIEHRPVTRAGFMMLIPPFLKEGTDPSQLQTPLDEVLEIIRYATRTNNAA